MYEVDWRTSGKVTSHTIDETSADTRFFLLVDALSTRYNKLPSDILRRSDTFDMLVYDVAVTYERYVHSKNNKDGNVADFVNKDHIAEIGRKYYGKG